MDIPDNHILSEDEYDLDEDQMDEEAPNQVEIIDRLFLPTGQDIESSSKDLELLENNDDMLVFDFPEFSNDNNDVPTNADNPIIFSNLPVTPDPVLQTEINRQWRKKDETTIELPLYNENKSCNVEMFKNCKSATDIFVKLLNPIIDHIVDQSNLYATQNNKTLKLSADELMGFIGINFCMGYHKLPSYRHYWSTAKDLHLQVISEVMSRDRFSEILSNIHVNDNTAIPANNKDKLYKLRPMID
ncbi:piggyBac transposable element-derived protein 3-like [Myzus persicae]|uniref:piggyBac transposable element-derived protein 3-like n=1 Tax=Myzus persicae TaxID=13164 RepID=UPI000B9394E9|nr:piggyBac transposable element-derived protein 3-like [Myzus persicae]